MSYRHIESVCEAVERNRSILDVIAAVDIDFLTIACEIGHKDMLLLVACDYIHHGSSGIEGSRTSAAEFIDKHRSLVASEAYNNIGSLSCKRYIGSLGVRRKSQVGNRVNVEQKFYRFTVDTEIHKLRHSVRDRIADKGSVIGLYHDFLAVRKVIFAVFGLSVILFASYAYKSGVRRHLCSYGNS